jgi:hypothetical protein
LEIEELGIHVQYETLYISDVLFILRHLDRIYNLLDRAYDLWEVGTPPEYFAFWPNDMSPFETTAYREAAT